MTEQAPVVNPDNQGPEAAHDEYAHLLDPNAPMVTDVEQAAVRPDANANPATTEAQRQMGIAAADRENRANAGLPPREFDLK